MRILFCPADFRGCERNMFAGSGAHNFTVLVREHRTGPSGADIDSKHVFHEFRRLRLERDSLAEPQTRSGLEIPSNPRASTTVSVHVRIKRWRDLCATE